jgi:hypothetical protein
MQRKWPLENPAANSFQSPENKLATPAELLAHIKIDTTHGTALDFNVDVAAAEMIANAACVDTGVVRSLTFPEMTPREASLTP